MISARTKAALAAAKARGVKLGNPRLEAGNPAGAAKARHAHASQARARAAELVGYIRQAQRAGAVTLRQIAAAMEARGIRTPSGRIRWHAATVRAILALAALPLALAA
jgi:DNA invertase Pin-like site-specific DNA recombinase